MWCIHGAEVTGEVGQEQVGQVQVTMERGGGDGRE